MNPELSVDILDFFKLLNKGNMINKFISFETICGFYQEYNSDNVLKALEFLEEKKLIKTTIINGQKYYKA